MGNIKAGTVIATGVVGGILGVTIAVIGKGMGSKMVGQIGDGVADSSLMTGEIVGDTLEGVTETAMGIAKKDAKGKKRGLGKLKKAGSDAVGNFTENIVVVAGATKDVATHTVKGDRKGAIRAGKKLFKIVTVGLITVGAIKVDTEEEDVK